ncbi:hypothetical protein AQUSIP_03700 [Aquicella siphonis]|uniref:Uncharacterized protein n=1 Tax=Aquicella siphonis TaxID=254247 RepID=A0A5E4PE47_9COXI|nr:cytochrome oxidase putative small subunit CydP [Aquicella siphonis]VVC75094.1 hypothetical protein AQUSIP_03700 [Aquicella siphonis]
MPDIPHHPEETVTKSSTEARTKAMSLMNTSAGLLSCMIRFLSKTHYRKEITLVVALKILALFLLWGLFFSHRDPDLLKTQKLVDHYISSTSI